MSQPLNGPIDLFDTRSPLRNKWHAKFMELASHVSTWSKDRSTKCGCVIVGPDKEIRSTGYNGMPRGVDDNRDDRHTRPEKYLWFEHAERNAIYNAARMGTALKDCTLFVRWFPCADCARAAVQVGIREIVCDPIDMSDPKNSRWAENMAVVPRMLAEAGVKLTYYENDMS